VIPRQSLLVVAAASLAASISIPTARAQGPGAPVYPVPYRAFVGINPLGIPFDIASFEVEGAVLPGVTVGGAASYNSVRGDVGAGGRDPRFGSGDIKVRYYPTEVPFRGFAVGLALGVTRYSSVVDVTTPAGVTAERHRVTAPTISILGDYNYVIGTRQRFVVGTGVGAKRLLASEEDRDRANAPRAWVFVRFVLGMAF
jgi:hypothetical protein